MEKAPCWYRNILSLSHTGILHYFMLEMSSGMEDGKILEWASDKMSFVHAGFLDSSMPEMSEEGLIFYILCSIIKGNCGVGV